MQPDAKVYLQFTCELPPLKQMERQKVGLYVAATMIFCCFFYLITLFYSKKLSELSYSEWDYNTATANDFCVKFLITNEVWTEWGK